MLEVAVFDPPLDFRQLFFPLFRVVMEESPGLLPSLLKLIVVKGFIHDTPQGHSRHSNCFKQCYFPFPKSK